MECIVREISGGLGNYCFRGESPKLPRNLGNFGTYATTFHPHHGPPSTLKLISFLCYNFPHIFPILLVEIWEYIFHFVRHSLPFINRLAFQPSPFNISLIFPFFILKRGKGDIYVPGRYGNILVSDN